MLLLKLLASLENAKLPQRQLSSALCISLSETNASFKRLLAARLLRKDIESDSLYPIISASEELLIHGLKYMFPGQLGEFTRGIVTGIAAPVFKGKISIGNEPLPIWPYAHGKEKGLALKPLYPSIPEAITKHPDSDFYDLLALVDIIRIGRARERKIAVEMLKEKIKQ